jgi:2-polyprenyl-3-methyl-5-hydroxy-6-metoxy-1,4-benzoquinol methylase
MKLLLYFHNFLYRVISHFAIKGGLHPKHRLTNYHKFFTDNVTEKDTVLDIGCGNGALTLEIGKIAGQVIGFDKELPFILKVIGNVVLAKMEVEFYPLSTPFDILVLSNVLEHIEDRQRFLKSFKGKVKKVLVRVPMLDRDWLTLYKKELGVEYRLDKGHFIEYTEQSFRDEVKEAGYKIVKLEIRFGEIYAILK